MNPVGGDYIFGIRLGEELGIPELAHLAGVTDSCKNASGMANRRFLQADAGDEGRSPTLALEAN